MNQIFVTKGKLLKGDVIEIDYRKSDGVESKPAECSEKHNAPPAKSLQDAFDSLAVHALLLGEFVETHELEDVEEELIKDFTVSGFTVTGKNDDGIILTAQKTLKSGKKLGFNTPLMGFNDESENAYPFIDELKEAVEKCQTELKEYLNGKHADDPQQKLFDDEK